MSKCVIRLQRHDRQTEELETGGKYLGIYGAGKFGRARNDFHTARTTQTQFTHQTPTQTWNLVNSV